MIKSAVGRASVFSSLMFVAVCSYPATGMVRVAVSPRDASLPANGQLKFFAQVTGAASSGVTWTVNGVPGGAPSMGTIDDNGVYQAPAGEPGAVKASIAATSKDDPLSSDTVPVSVAAPTTTGKTYYVAKNGNDGGAGSIDAPWKTIQHAVDSVAAGATIQVAGGVYKELVNVNRSGSASAGFITVMSAPGQTAVVDGGGLKPSDSPGNIGLITLTDVSYVRIKGLELRNFESADPSAFAPAGIYVTGAGSHIEIRNNLIHDIRTTDQTTQANAFGLAVYGTKATPISDLIVDGNTLHDLTLGQSESLPINGNVTRWQVTRNTIYRNDNIGIDAIGLEKTAPVDDQARNGWIADNDIRDTTSSNNPTYGNEPSAGGIYVDGGTRITIERNSVSGADIGVELASEHKAKITSQVLVRDNVIRDSIVTGLSMGGYKSAAGGTTYCTVINNTFFNNDTSASGSGELQIQYNAENNLVANNIFHTGDQGLFLNSTVKDTRKTATFENNIYFTTADSSAMTWRWKGVDYATLESFERSSKASVRGLVADPRFVGTGKHPLAISTGSPAVAYGVDKGAAVQGPLDQAGSPRLASDGSIDAGALQH
ncbi:hypothetical protein KCV01_g20501, partial [Aureobasidium melanogenum]